MSKTIVKVIGLSKAYQLGVIGTGTISRDLERYWARVTGRADPFLKIGEINDRESKGKSDVVWSLKNINLEIEQGDAIGIIGRNGAGKSTLLKLLSRVTAPTTGGIKVKGRIASLLEVGTGFHPELSGRENIFLNGAILGMRKREIARRFEEIVAFSGVERYIDTPVKRYSSGMYVRLAFAVAAHLESEILIVDEVLAVGDAEFQKKCLGKMGEVSKGEGRTLLFVSHQMQAIQKLCNKTLLLNKGIAEEFDETGRVVNAYLGNLQLSEALQKFIMPPGAMESVGYALQLQVENANGIIAREIAVGTPWQVRILFRINHKADHFIVGLGLNSFTDINIKTSWSRVYVLGEGYYEVVFKELNLILSPGVYYLTLGLSNSERAIHYLENCASFVISEAVNATIEPTILKVNTNGLILNAMDVELNSINLT